MAAIANPALISVDEYIQRFVEGNEKPKFEYVDGELIPKSMATRNHSQVQSNLIFLIRSQYQNIFNPLPELSTRVKPTKFYIPDLSVHESAKPIEGRYPGPDNPVFLCVEIISPPDRLGWLFHKCEEYHRWKVPYCWVIDPDEKIAWEYFPDDREPRKITTDVITAGPIKLALAKVFELV